MGAKDIFHFKIKNFFFFLSQFSFSKWKSGLFPSFFPPKGHFLSFFFRNSENQDDSSRSQSRALLPNETRDSDGPFSAKAHSIPVEFFLGIDPQSPNASRHTHTHTTIWMHILRLLCPGIPFSIYIEYIKEMRKNKKRNAGCADGGKRLGYQRWYWLPAWIRLPSTPRSLLQFTMETRAPLLYRTHSPPLVLSL